MSKSTGNFLTLRQAVDKFSADGKFYSLLPHFLDSSRPNTTYNAGGAGAITKFNQSERFASC